MLPLHLKIHYVLHSKSNEKIVIPYHKSKEIPQQNNILYPVQQKLIWAQSLFLHYFEPCKRALGRFK